MTHISRSRPFIHAWQPMAGLALLSIALAAPLSPVRAATPTAAKPTSATTTAPSLIAGQSELGFTAKQMGVPVEGKFKRFEAQLQFDPKQLATAHVRFNIDLGSATLGDPMFDAELVKPAWFDSKRLPQAQFVSSQIKGLGGGRYEVLGKLSIKGQSRDLTVPLSLSQAGAVSTASGSFVIKRLEFKIGDGEWSDTSMVANEVQVKFKFAFSGMPPL